MCIGITRSSFFQQEFRIQPSSYPYMIFRPTDRFCSRRTRSLDWSWYRHCILDGSKLLGMSLFLFLSDALQPLHRPSAVPASRLSQPCSLIFGCCDSHGVTAENLDPNHHNTFITDSKVVKYAGGPCSCTKPWISDNWVYKPSRKERVMVRGFAF